MQRLVCPRVVVALPPTDDGTNLTPASRLLAALGRSPISQNSVLPACAESACEVDADTECESDVGEDEDEEIEVDVEGCAVASRTDHEDDEDAMDLSRHLSEDDTRQDQTPSPPASVATPHQPVSAPAVSCSSSGSVGHGHRLAFSVENILDPTKFTGRALCWRPLDGAPADDELSCSDLGKSTFEKN